MKTSSASEISVSIYQSTSRIVPERLESSAIIWIGFLFLWYVTTFYSNFYWLKRLYLSSIGRRIIFAHVVKRQKPLELEYEGLPSKICHPQNGKNGTTEHIFSAWEQISNFEGKRSWITLTVAASLQSFTRSAELGTRSAARKAIISAKFSD